MKNFAAFVIGIVATGCASLPADARHVGNPTPVVAPSGPFPSTQNIAFGAKTLNLFGGDPMQYSTQSALGVTRWLKITAMTNESGTNIIGTPIFQLDDRFFLTPRSTAGGGADTVYGGSWGQATQCDSAPYCSVTVTEYSDSGMTIPTGYSTVIAARTDAVGVYTWRENTSSSFGCVNPVTGVSGQNCEVTNTDDTTGAGFPPSGGQLSTILSLTLNSDTDSLVERTGFYNPTGETYQAVPSVAWTGTGTIIVSSEVKDIGTLDSYGNPNLKSGGKIGGFQLKSFSIGDVNWPLQFDYIYFYTDYATASIPFISFNDNEGYGVTVTHSRLEQTCNATTPQAKIRLNAAFVANDNTLQSCPGVNGGVDIGSNTGIQNDNSSDWTRAGMTAFRNVFEFPTSDPIHLNGCNHDIEMNFIFGAREVGMGHLDSAQHDGLNDGVTGCNFGKIYYNIQANGPADSSNSAAQGFPFVNHTIDSGTQKFTGGQFYDNMNLAPNDGNCQYFTKMDNFDARGNADVWTPQTTTPFAVSPCQLSARSGEGGTGATVIGNYWNSVDLSGQSGTVTQTNNHAITWANNSTGCNAVKAKFANFVCGDNPLETNRAYVLNEMKPANRMDTANGDGTFAGPIWPQMDGGEWCFAVSATVVDFTKSCALNGAIPIQ